MKTEEVAFARAIKVSSDGLTVPLGGLRIAPTGLYDTLMSEVLADSAREAEQARLNQQEPVDVPGSTP